MQRKYLLLGAIIAGLLISNLLSLVIAYNLGSANRGTSAPVSEVTVVPTETGSDKTITPTTTPTTSPFTTNEPSDITLRILEEKNGSKVYDILGYSLEVPDTYSVKIDDIGYKVVTVEPLANKDFGGPERMIFTGYVEPLSFGPDAWTPGFDSEVMIADQRYQKLASVFIEGGEFKNNAREFIEGYLVYNIFHEGLYIRQSTFGGISNYAGSEKVEDLVRNLILNEQGQEQMSRMDEILKTLKKID